jgi:hypothetical protein
MRRLIAPTGLAALLLATTSRLGTDYPADAGPAISALARGDLHGFASDQAQMGPLSLLLRAPLAAIAGADSIWAYRLGALTCLLALVAFGAAVARRAPASFAPTAALLLVVNPVTIDALRLGHPEELLGAALCAGALLLARERALIAGVALGAALATKQWALIAIAPVLLAAPRAARVRLSLAAGGVVAAIVVPLALADPHAFLQALRHPAFGVAEMRTGNVWGWAAITNHITLGPGETATAYTVPDWLQHGAHPLVALITLGLGGVALAPRNRPAGAARAPDARTLRTGPVEPRLLPRALPGGTDRVGGGRGAPRPVAVGCVRRFPRRGVRPVAAARRRALHRVGAAAGGVAQPACPALGAGAPAPGAARTCRVEPRRVARRARSCTGRSTPYHDAAATANAIGATTISAPTVDSGSSPCARRNSSSGTCHR